MNDINSMDKRQLEEHLIYALNRFIKKDEYLLTHDAHEQSISGKIACYLAEKIPPPSENGWSVDVEYNRDISKPKSLSSGNVRPDIIIHRRGLKNLNQTENNNLLIVEFKVDATDEEKKKDLEKIEKLINEPPYYYKYGVFVEFKSDSTGIFSHDRTWRPRD